jgi:hypothetical protein
VRSVAESPTPGDVVGGLEHRDVDGRDVVVIDTCCADRVRTVSIGACP